MQFCDISTFSSASALLSKGSGVRPHFLGQRYVEYTQSKISTIGYGH